MRVIVIARSSRDLLRSFVVGCPLQKLWTVLSRSREHRARGRHPTAPHFFGSRSEFVQIIRVCRERDKALVFRGWSRLCLHAASLCAAEGASAAACAKARAARTEAMEKEAEAAAEKAEAWRRAAVASAEVAAAREQAKRSSLGVSMLTAELKEREADTAQMAREHQLRRMKMLVRVNTRLPNGSGLDRGR